MDAYLVLGLLFCVLYAYWHNFHRKERKKQTKMQNKKTGLVKPDNARGEGVGGLKPPPDFLANNILWGCGHAKVGMVVQKFHVCGLQPPHF